MISMKVKEEKFISWSNARKILEKKGKEKELGYEQKNALEFLRKFSKLTDKKASEMAGELSKITRLKEKHAIMVMDMMPRKDDEIRVLFSQEIISLTEDDKKKILSIVKKYS